MHCYDFVITQYTSFIVRIASAVAQQEQLAPLNGPSRAHSQFFPVLDGRLGCQSPPLIVSFVSSLLMQGIYIHTAKNVLIQVCRTAANSTVMGCGEMEVKADFKYP